MALPYQLIAGLGGLGQGLVQGQQAADLHAFNQLRMQLAQQQQQALAAAGQGLSAWDQAYGGAGQLQGLPQQGGTAPGYTPPYNAPIQSQPLAPPQFNTGSGFSQPNLPSPTIGLQPGPGQAGSFDPLSSSMLASASPFGRANQQTADLPSVGPTIPGLNPGANIPGLQPGGTTPGGFNAFGNLAAASPWAVAQQSPTGGGPQVALQTPAQANAPVQPSYTGTGIPIIDALSGLFGGSAQAAQPQQNGSAPQIPPSGGDPPTDPNMTGPQAGEPVQSYVATFGPQPGDRQAGGPTAPEQQMLNTIKHRESDGNYADVSKTSTASGAYQFLDSTWAETAKASGVGGQYRRAVDAPKEVQDYNALFLLRQKGAQPWSPSGPYPAIGGHPAVGRMIQTSNISQKQQGLPHSGVDQASEIAAGAVANTPSLAEIANMGKQQLHEIIAAVDKANPGADPAVKFLAVSQLNTLLNPQDKMMFQYMMAQQRQDFQKWALETRLADADARAGAREGDVTQVFEDPQSHKMFGLTRGGAAKPLDLPGGAAKPGQVYGAEQAGARQDKAIAAREKLQQEVQDRIQKRADEGRRIRQSMQTAAQKNSALKSLYSQNEQDIRTWEAQYGRSGMRDEAYLAMIEKRKELEGMMRELGGVPEQQAKPEIAPAKPSGPQAGPTGW